MKKEYESPKAEKVEFDYEEVVVASNQCRTGGEYSDVGNGCNSTHSEWKADVT